MAHPGNLRPIQPKPPASLNNENVILKKRPFILRGPPGRGANRHMPEKWQRWEQKHLDAWFASDPNPTPSVRKQFAIELMQDNILRQMSGRAHKDLKLACKAIKIAWNTYYRRRITNWFKNARAGLKKGRIPGLPLEEDLPEESFNPETPIDANQPAIAAEPNNTTTLTPYASGSSFRGNYDGGDEYKPTPRVLLRLPNRNTTTESTLNDSPAPNNPTSVVYGARLIIKLKGRIAQNSQI